VLPPVVKFVSKHTRRDQIEPTSDQTKRFRALPLLPVRRFGLVVLIPDLLYKLT